MPTALLDFEHELMTEGGAASLLFGKIDRTRSPYWTMEHPAINGGDDTYGDVPLEREDGVAFGEDYAGAKTVTFELQVDTKNATNPHVANADALERLEAAWTNPLWRSQSGAVAVLRSRMVPGRVRRAYGRPRRYAETVGRLHHKGLSSVVCDFVVGDGKWYDDVEQSKTIPAVVSSTNTHSITVAGTQETWPVITINGPVVWPTLFIGPWVVGFPITLGVGQSITIDPRPWVRTILRNDGANLAGEVMPATPPMRKMYLPPGTYGVRLSCLSHFGGSATIRWRSAYKRW